MTFLANTLHHIPDRECLTNALESLFAVSRKVILFEIEDPGLVGGFPKFLNRFWYHWFLKDQGVSYLSEKQFTGIITDKFKNVAMLKSSKFNKIQGTYLICEIEKKLGTSHVGQEFEVEQKFRVKDPILIQKAAYENGFTPRPTQTERDTYFSDPDASFVANRTCLRVRSNEAGVSIDFKPSSKDRGSRFSKIESNLSLGHNDYSKAINFLRSMDFVPHVEVIKERTSYEKNLSDIKISVVVDSVAHDTFCEIEATGPVEKTREVHEAFEVFKSKLSKCLDSEFNDPYRDFIATNRMKLLGENKTHLLFDLDDTIIPTETIFYECFSEEVREVAGQSVDINEYIRYETEHPEQYFEKFIKDHSGNLNAGKFYDNIRSKYAAKISALCEQGYFADYFAKLEPLTHDYKLSLVTMSPRKVVNDILSSSNAENIFADIICREDVKKLKPAPDAYLTAIQRLGVSSENCVVIEDSKRGVIAAIEAELKVAVIKSPFTQRNGWLEGLDCPVFGSIDEFAFNLSIYK